MPHTVLPHATDAHANDALASVAALLKVTDVPALVGPDGKQIPLPHDLYEVMRDVVGALMEGKAVSVAPHTALMTTQQAAEFLGVSRPTVVKLLEGGQIPFSQPGTHRRVQVGDLLEYQRAIGSERRRTLDELTRRETAEGTRADAFIETR
jgi:excisionase family DNA binding protein